MQEFRGLESGEIQETDDVGVREVHILYAGEDE